MALRVICLSIVVTLCACAAQNRPLQLLSGGGPEYPVEARAQGIEGRVDVRYDVTVDGRVENAMVLRSEPAGCSMRRRWRLLPTAVNAPLVEGGRVRAEGRVSTVYFRLSRGEAYERCGVLRAAAADEMGRVSESGGCCGARSELCADAPIR